VIDRTALFVKLDKPFNEGPCFATTSVMVPFGCSFKLDFTESFMVLSECFPNNSCPRVDNDMHTRDIRFEETTLFDIALA
jgi:hypothetical protein